MGKTYFREKIIKLHDKLFLSCKDARLSFIDNEENWEMAFLASKTLSDTETISEWAKIWLELNSRKSPYIDRSDFVHTILSKRKSSLERYLLFVLEQYSKVCN